MDALSKARVPDLATNDAIDTDMNGDTKLV